MLTTKTVYSLYYPETRRIVDALWREAPHHLYERNYTKRQDAMHGPFLDAWRRFATAAGVRLGDGFPNEYPVAGANEGIFALISRLSARSATERPRIHVFLGEYEGFQHLAAAAFLETRFHSRDPERYRASFVRDARAGDWVFVSQPSAIDGNVWSEFPDFLSFLNETLPDVPVCVDLTYVGAVAREYAIDLTSPSVAAVIASLSKPFGVYYHRIGVTLSREPIASLYGNLWFKNLFSLALGERLVTQHGPRDLPTRYQSLQARVLERAALGHEISAEARASDVVLLASATLPKDADVDARFQDFVRARDESGTVLRFCLSPGMDALL
jgi:histidinol-phosphate/aromatic aminotransferase/cobyric acid decarboxylase-like protein